MAIADDYSMAQRRLVPGVANVRDLKKYDYRGLTRTQFLAKRSFDLVAAIILLVLLLPLFVCLAILVRATSEGPALFKQPRVGYRGRLFICYKFRSMYLSSQDLLCEKQTVVGDPRVTPVGRWLRKLSLDELPQLFNVVLGTMSLVGPRPHAPATKAGNTPFHSAMEHYDLRHNVLPGITGLAQVRGLRGQTKTVEDILRRVDVDLEYIQRWSMLLDVKVLLKTVFVVVDQDAF